MYSPEEAMMKQSVTITTRCPLIIRNWALQNNVKIPRILWAGYETLTRKKPDEIQELTTKVNVLADKLNRANKKLWDLEGQMEMKDESTIRK